MLFRSKSDSQPPTEIHPTPNRLAQLHHGERLVGLEQFASEFSLGLRREDTGELVPLALASVFAPKSDSLPLESNSTTAQPANLRSQSERFDEWKV